MRFLLLLLLCIPMTATEWTKWYCTPAFILSGRAQWLATVHTDYPVSDKRVTYFDDLDTFSDSCPTYWLRSLRKENLPEEVSFILDTFRDDQNRRKNTTTMTLNLRFLAQRLYKVTISSDTVIAEAWIQIGQSAGIEARVINSVYQFGSGAAFKLSLGSLYGKPSWIMEFDSSFPRHYAQALALTVTAINRYVDPQRVKDPYNPFNGIIQAAF